MKRILFKTMQMTFIALLGAAWVNGSIFAQDRTGRTEPEIRIPFIDKDGDGINDLLQNGWGLKFIQRFKNRRAVWSEMNKDGEKGNILIDTDNDGKPDTTLRDVLKEKMDQLVDTDGDGKPDTPLREHLKRKFQMMDVDGDGIPDELSAEEIRRQLQEMKEWRKNVKNNLINGRPAFTDKDGDGKPDDMPAFFGRLWSRKAGRK